jgi:anthranilate/para-aminobenzoate synthase component II
MWFLDSNGNAIKTINASKQTVKYQFTTTATTAFVSISYGPSTPKDTLSISVVHNYKNGVCLGCGATSP